MLRAALVLQDIGIGLAITALALMAAAMAGIVSPGWAMVAATSSVLCAIAFTAALIAARRYDRSQSNG